jgi:[acyl-carrier-protein] S-malonyltransferase
MAPARDRLTPELNALDFRDLQIPLVNNADAGEIRQANRARDSLIRQICAPVRWEETVRYLVQAGIESFVEVGPGKVLSGLVRKIAPQAKTFSVEGIRGVEALASTFSDAKM